MDLAFQGPFKRYIQEHVDATFATGLADHLLAGKPHETFELSLTKSQLEGPFVTALGKVYERLVGPESLNLRVSGWALAGTAWDVAVQRVALEAHEQGALFEHNALEVVEAVAEIAAVVDGADVVDCLASVQRAPMEQTTMRAEMLLSMVMMAWRRRLALRWRTKSWKMKVRTRIAVMPTTATATAMGMMMATTLVVLLQQCLFSKQLCKLAR